MKTKSIILSGLLFLTLSVMLSSYITKKSMDNVRTEEYAIVDVIDNGKKKLIRVTKDSEPTTETEWIREKTEDRDDYRPVLNVLNQLNEQGFELLNGSLAYETISGGNAGFPRQTYFMIKKAR